MNNKFCDSCGMEVIGSMRICPTCGNRNFSDTPQSNINAKNIPYVTPANNQQIPSKNQKINTSLNPATLWNRVWARGIDVVLASLIGLIITSILPSIDPVGSGIATLIIDILTSAVIFCIVIALYDTVFLSTIGTTPGKAMMGLIVRSSNGEILSASMAHQRSWKMLGSGLTYMIWFPVIQFINLILIIKSGSTKWDNREFGVVLQRPIGSARKFIVILIAIFLMLTLIVVQTAVKQINKNEIRQTILNS